MKSFWRGLLAWKTGACLAFTGASVIYLIIAALMGERTVSILTLIGLLVVSVAGTAIQYLCFASPRTEGWRYSLRLGLFALLFLPLLSACAGVFRWIPAEYPSAWLIFFGLFLLAFVVMTAGFEVYYRIAGKKYDGLLGEYKRERGKR